MEDKDILFTGGSGLLGTHLKEYFPDSRFPSSAELNINKSNDIAMKGIFNKPKMIVHMAAYTSTIMIENEKDDQLKALNTNIKGTCNIVDYCIQNDIKLVYISTDYVFDGELHEDKVYHPQDATNPQTLYGISKLGGECAVRMHNNSLIVRTSFWQDEFPYDKAFGDQWSTRMKVSECAKELSKIIRSNRLGIVHLAGEKGTIYDLALNNTEKEISKISRMDIKNYPIPYNTSLNNSVES